jgi:hypothetical protein
VPTIEPKHWEDSEEWKEMIAPQLHSDFLQRLEESKREGYRVNEVLVINGVAVLWNVSQVD